MDRRSLGLLHEPPQVRIPVGQQPDDDAPEFVAAKLLESAGEIKPFTGR